MKSIVTPGIVLLIVCVIASAILGYVNAITAAPIAEADAKTKNEKKSEAYEAEWGEEVAVLDDTTSVTGYTPSTDGKAFAISTESNGFSSGLKLMFAVSDEGKILGMSVVDCSNETPGLGANAGADPAFREQYKDKDLSAGDLAVKKDGGDIDALTGATITSRAVTNAANDALKFYENVIKKGGSAPASDEGANVSDAEEETNKDASAEETTAADETAAEEETSAEEAVSEEETSAEEIVSEEETISEDVTAEEDTKIEEETASEEDTDKEGGAEDESGKDN